MESSTNSTKTINTTITTTHSNKKQHIPRPKNSFMTYRQSKMASILQDYGQINNKEISKLCGEMWNKEPESVKEHFRQLAEINKLEHQRLYPNYKYAPKKGNKKLKKSKIKKRINNENEFNEFIENHLIIDEHLPNCPYSNLYNNNNNNNYQIKLNELISTHPFYLSDLTMNSNLLFQSNFCSNNNNNNNNNTTTTYNTMPYFLPPTMNYLQPSYYLLPNNDNNNNNDNNIQSNSNSLSDELLGQYIHLDRLSNSIIQQQPSLSLPLTNFSFPIEKEVSDSSDSHNNVISNNINMNWNHLNLYNDINIIHDPNTLQIKQESNGFNFYY